MVQFINTVIFPFIDFQIQGRISTVPSTGQYEKDN